MAGKTIKPTVHVEVDSEYPHAFDGIQNWRDVGATINGFMGRRFVEIVHPTDALTYLPRLIVSLN